MQFSRVFSPGLLCPPSIASARRRVPTTDPNSRTKSPPVKSASNAFCYSFSVTLWSAFRRHPILVLIPTWLRSLGYLLFKSLSASVFYLCFICG